MNDLSKFEADLWAAADNLRANSKLTSSDYFMPVLGVIFLRHAANRFDTATKQIEEEQAAGKMPKRKVQPADYIRRRALWLPESARFDEIMKRATTATGGLPKLVTDAMTAIEADFEPLAGVLPKDYGIFEPHVLEDLMRLFNSEQIKRATGDVFGRIYEYFLARFSIQKAHDNGEFFTPSSLVQTIVNVIEPEHGTVFDPACGSAGMFVQSSHFIEHAGGDTARKVVFYGQEKNRDTIRIAKMNLAVHGLEGRIAEAITYYQDEHNLRGKCDFVMANPPFNVDLVDAERVKTDPRLPFGLPGVNKAKKVSNGNYLWISYFWSYLSDQGRAGFVMSSQASSAGNDEKEVRRKIVQTGDVDVMISIRGGFFYTRTVPCELWFFDRHKPKERKDTVLMLDARAIGQLMPGSRKVFEFRPEQLANISAIVWLYRGQSERFIQLLARYHETARGALDVLSHTLCAFHTEETEPLNTVLNRLQEFAGDAAAGAEGLDLDKTALVNQVRALRENLQLLTTEGGRLHGPIQEWREQMTKVEGAPPKKQLQTITRQLPELESMAAQVRELGRQIDAFWKALHVALDFADDKLAARRSKTWKGWKLRDSLDEHEDARRRAHEDIHQFDYFRRQMHWLLHRFPDAQFVPVLGLCRAVTRAEIEAADWSLAPGRYVGVAPAEVDENFDFAQSIGDIHTELAELNKEAAKLGRKIQENLQELAI